MNQRDQTMERLRDQCDSDDPVLARAARLVSSESAHVPSLERRRRVLAKVRQGGRVRRPMLLRPAFAAVLVLGLVAVASAMLTRPWRRWTSQPAPAPEAPMIPPAPVSSTATVTETPPPPVVTPPALAPIPLPQPIVAPPSSRPRKTATPRPASNTTAPPSTESPPPTAPAPAAAPAASQLERENILLQAATRALRTERDPERAGVLLDDYLRHYPRGQLVEEGLALAIEAAARRNDARAAELAMDYIKRFPSGRYRAAADKALQRFGD